MAIEPINHETDAEQNKLWIVSGHAYSRTGDGHYNLIPVLRRGTKKAFGKMVDDFIEWLNDNDLIVYPDSESTIPKTVKMDELEPEGIFSDTHQEAMSAGGNTVITEVALRGYLAKTLPRSLFAQQTGTDNYIDIQMTEAVDEQEYINNAVWDMTKKQFTELKDDIIAMDGDDRILGTVNIGGLRLAFDVESKETRRSLGVAPGGQRIGVLLLATGEDSDGFVHYNYTDLGDFTYDELKKTMKGCFDTVYELNFHGFKKIVEQWIVETVHNSEEFQSGEIDDSVFNRPIPKWS